MGLRKKIEDIADELDPTPQYNHETSGYVRRSVIAARLRALLK